MATQVVSRLPRVASQFVERAIKNFWRRVRRGSVDVCWPFLGGKDKDGYGKFQVHDGKTKGPKGQIHVRAHVFAHWLATGELPPVTMHTCDNPPCCNAAHLRSGTQALNRADATRKGRNATGTRNGSYTHPESRVRGLRHWNGKLSDVQVAEIRRRYVPRKGVGALAREFGVHPGTISAIGAGRWRRTS